MKKINSLSDILTKELADLLNAENQLAGALPEMAQAGQSPALKTTLKDCLEITREQVNRLQDIFSNIGRNPPKLICKAMKGLITETEDMLNDPQRLPVRDAAIINVAQRVEEYEIAGYKKARKHAADLGHAFNELAQGIINTHTIDPKRGGFYIPKGKFMKGKLKKKVKSTDVSRFISEGNPNIQEDNDKGKEKEGQNSQDPKEEGDLS